jgi:hypothetical protein
MSDDENEITDQVNDQLVLICGISASGKSASLRKIENQPKWIYMGTEAGKRLPFKNKFTSARITNPYQVIEGFDYAMANPDDVDGIIIDSVTFLMDMFETQYVIGSANTMKAWGDYQQFFKQLMMKVAEFGKPVLILAHVLDVYDESSMSTKTSVPIKGALKNNGIEAWFSTVVYAKKVTIKELEKYGSDLLEITDEERELGYKHVFQTSITKSTVGERIRSPMGLFNKSQTYMDNDAQLLLNHLHKFYA